MKRIRARTTGEGTIDESKRLLVHGKSLRGVDFSGRELTQFSSAGSRFERCRFDNTVIEEASFSGGRKQSDYIDCTFDAARIRFGPSGYSRLVRCSFQDVDLRDWFGFTVELVDCMFSGRMRHSVFNGSVPERDRSILRRDRNEFRGNDFSAMQLIDVDFRTGIDLSVQRLPTGEEYLYLPDAATILHRARAEALRWLDLKVRIEAIKLIDVINLSTEGGQRQLLLREDTYVSFPRDVVHPVFELLRRIG